MSAAGAVTFLTMILVAAVLTAFIRIIWHVGVEDDGPSRPVAATPTRMIWAAALTLAAVLLAITGLWRGDESFPALFVGLVAGWVGFGVLDRRFGWRETIPE